MTSKRIFPWSKQHSGVETYYRTGGLLPIDTSADIASSGVDVKATSLAGLPPLKIIPHDNKPYLLVPLSASYSSALTNATTSLQTAFNDMLRSPAPGRPSLPSSPDLPVELPGSILLQNQGFTPCGIQKLPTSICPISQTIRPGIHPPGNYVDCYEELLDTLDTSPRTLNHPSSVPVLDHQVHNMRSARSANAVNAQKVQHKKSLSDATLKTRSRSNLVIPPCSTDSRLATCSASTINEDGVSSTKPSVGVSKLPQSSSLNTAGQPVTSNTGKCANRRSEVGVNKAPAPAATQRRQIEELKSTIAAQDQTISSLQTQFGSLRASNEAHVTSLTRAHVAEVASLKNHARVLEEQLAHRPSLHHASSNNLLFSLVLDTTEPRTPARECLRSTDTGSASSTKSFKSAIEEQQPPQQSRKRPEMESLKRKLSTTRRPETANRNLLPELNQYKQNNVALQKQIESLMAKLNESKKSERALKTSLTEAEVRCNNLQQQISETNESEHTARALQNTIDHLESRLEVANVERLDAQEQLWNLQVSRSPFDIALPKLQIGAKDNSESSQRVQDPHLSMSTVFSSESPTSPETESQELPTLATFIAHIERLQDQTRQQDARILELEAESDHLRQKKEQLEHEHNANNLQMEIQNDLLQKAQQMDTHVEQLRSAVIDREAIIGQKEKAIRTIERQLEHHKLLLQAEIRRHATLSQSTAAGRDPLPELSTIVAKSDIDRWITRLQDRLRKDKSAGSATDPPKAQVESLKQEIDFYVREIIFYKLDIRGYKSDVRKLKKITAQLSSYGSRSGDLDSETSSLRPEMTPREQFTSDSPKMPALDTSSANKPRSKSNGDAPITPPLSGSALNQGFQSEIIPEEQHCEVDLPATPQTPTRDTSLKLKIVTDDHRLSPRSIAQLSPERRKPTPPSPERERFGDLLTNFPLSTPAVPLTYLKRRSSSESTIRRYIEPETAFESSPEPDSEDWDTRSYKFSAGRVRSASLPESGRTRMTPDRPPRPRCGLFDSSNAAAPALSIPSRTNVFPEAMRRFPSEDTTTQLPNPRQGSHMWSTLVVASPTRETQPSPASPPPQAMQRSRAGSVGSNITNTQARISSPPERKLSAASASSVPFVIAMGSPHNPALVSPTTTMPPSSCSITRNAPLKLPATSRTGVGGTMASSTPVTSPTEAPSIDPPWRVPVLESIQNAGLKPARKFSMSRKQEQPLPSTPHTPSHSRNVSTSSIRTAFRLPTAREKEDAHRARKDSISMPQPLGSPFRVERSGSSSGWKEHQEAGGNEREEFGEAF